MIAILGAGDLGGAIAQRLAERARVGGVRLIDEAAGVAAGKALDIRQSGPVLRSDVHVTAASDALDAVGADVIVLAGDVGGGEWTGARGLALVEKLERAGSRAPLVFAGPGQAELMEACAAKLGVAANRMMGTAVGAAVGAIRALAGAEIDQSGVDVSIALAGRPPSLVIGWSAARVGGALLSERLAAHRMLAVSSKLARLWPPGPYAIASATAPVVEALVRGSRRQHQALAILEGEYGVRGVAAMLLLTLGHGRILARSEPTLSPRERTGTGLFSTGTA